MHFDTGAREQDLCGTAESRGDHAHLVLDDCYATAVVLLQQSIQQGGLPRPQEASDDLRKERGSASHLTLQGTFSI